MDIQLQEQIKMAAQVIDEGGVVILPADTVYGIFGSVAHEEAIDRVYQIKGRKRGKPFGVVSVPEQIANVVNLSSEAKAIVDTFWPAPVSLIAEKRVETIPEHFSGDEKGLLVVCAENPILAGVIKACKAPVFSTTCNFSGEDEARSAEDLQPFVNLVDFHIENTLFEFKGRPSTILNTMISPPALIREGAIAMQDIENRLPEVTRNEALLIQ